MKDIKTSKKLLIPIRRIEIAGISFNIRPSFVMPYMTQLAFLMKNIKDRDILLVNCVGDLFVPLFAA